jgi:hypothetical protein
MPSLTEDIAACAAALVVEEGLEYAAAKRKAVKHMGLSSRSALPSSDQVNEQVRQYIALYCADTQPAELSALRELALVWMGKLARLAPSAQVLITGAVWQGTATRLSDIHLHVFVDDGKSLEIALLNAGVDYEVGETGLPHRGEGSRLSVHLPCPALGEHVGLHLSVFDSDAQRGALRTQTKGRAASGTAEQLKQLMLGAG